MMNKGEMGKMEREQSIVGIARANFRKWNDALQTKDPRKVALLYCENNTFHPTMSGDFKSGQKGAEDYFEHFLLKNPLGKVVKEEIQPLGSDSYIHSGLYDFEVGPVDKREIAEARFTYVWVRGLDGEWKILHHHSSVKPN
jgi:uncharacterized protein (TIGR02246 family)